MEQLAIEMMGIAVISEIQAKDIIAIREQARTRVQQVARLHAAFPAMQKHDKPARTREHMLRCVQSQQTHAVAAIDHMLAGTVFEGGQTSPEQHATHATRGQY